MRAKRTVTVFRAHRVLALRTSGVKIVFALRAEIKARAHGATALGAIEYQGLPDKEVEDITDRVGNKNHHDRPQSDIHSPPLGIAIDVPDQKTNCRNQNAPQDHE